MRCKVRGVVVKYKRMKKYISLICCTALLALAVPLAACGGVEVKYTLSEDGTYYIVSDVVGNELALKSYTVPAEYSTGGGELLPVKEIGDGAFSECPYLHSVTLPEGIERIGDRAFMLCGINSFTIPESVTYIGYGAFAYCTALREIVIPEAVTSIGEKAFAYCENLVKADIKASVTYLPEQLFVARYSQSGGNVFTATELVEVHVPATVQKIHYNAFDGNFLTDIYFGGSKQQWDELYFYYYEKIEGEDGEEDRYEEKKVEDKDKVIPGVTVHYAESE